MKILLINPPVLTVDPVQTCMYAESIPFGLIKIATYLRQNGHDIHFVDMMGYWDGDFEKSCSDDYLWDYKRAGDNSVTDCVVPVYLYGMNLTNLEHILAGIEPPDEIYVTTCISYNFEIAFRIIEICKKQFSNAYIRFGGFYASYFPEHARKSNADEIFVGNYKEAENLSPDLSVLPSIPPVWITKLSIGCKYRCSYCANAFYDSTQIYSPVQAVDDIEKVFLRYNISTFSNWDPNIMLNRSVLNEFLDEIIKRELPVELKFEMGIQPNLLTEETALKMYRAGCRSMTIPFESANPEMMKRFGKPYRIESSIRAMQMCKKIGFDVSKFHCTFVVGIRNEGLAHVFETYFSILRTGGWPTPFPLSVTPGTKEWELHKEYIDGKELDELNGHLWPCLGSREKVELYQAILRIISRPADDETPDHVNLLPEKVREEFSKYESRYRIV